MTDIVCAVVKRTQDAGNNTVMCTCKLCDLVFALSSNSRRICPDCAAICRYHPDHMSLWERVRLRITTNTSGQRTPVFIGAGSYGAVFQGTVLVPRTHTPEELEYLTNLPEPAAEEDPDLTYERRPCVVKIPRRFLQITDCDVQGNGELIYHIAKPPRDTLLLQLLKQKRGLDKYDRAELFKTAAGRDYSKSMKKVIDDFQRELEMTHTLMFSAAHAKLLSDEQPRFTMYELEQANASKTQNANRGHAYLNRMLDFTMTPVPLMLTVQRPFTLLQIKREYWGRWDAPTDVFRVAVYQVYWGVRYMHSMGLSHNDIKHENVLCEEWRPATGRPGKLFVRCFISDFGFCTDTEYQTTKMCSPHFAAPELLDRTVDARDTIPRCCDAYGFALMMLSLLFWDDDDEKALIAADICKSIVPPCTQRITNFVDTSNGGSRNVRIDWDAIQDPVARSLKRILECDEPEDRYTILLQMADPLEAYSPERFTDNAFKDDVWKL